MKEDLYYDPALLTAKSWNQRYKFVFLLFVMIVLFIMGTQLTDGLPELTFTHRIGMVLEIAILIWFSMAMFYVLIEKRLNPVMDK